MQKIKNIIFDLGGIFLNINYPQTEKAFIDLGITNFGELYNQHHASDLFELLETGKITPKQFYNDFREVSATAVTDEQIKHAWNAMLLDFPKERLTWLDGIRNRYKVFLFSNTNQIHYDAFTKTFQKETGQKSFDDYFIKAYYSHELGFRKPYPASFLEVLNEQQLDAAETLFIDDTLKNVEGASQVGLQTIHLILPKTVLELDL